MKVEFEKNWNGTDSKYNTPNHDSSYSQQQVCQLIAQVRELEGIKDKNYTGVPSVIKIFAEKSLWGDERIIYVVKGIHQRWGQQNPHPHIRVRTYHTVGPSGMKVWVDFHIELSQEFTKQPSQHVDAEEGYVACAWTAVGISYVTYGPDGRIKANSTVECWPAQFSQYTGWIQDNAGPVGNRKRRLSVGCRPAPMQLQWRTEK
ncbi:hypothetical protein J8F10_13335 [Gemmata sp. G18]|uniref:Uncharacterized protein n=1 Tax=Gemmata palustris TaxID=2822762 RepID=A0ABS5BRA1_9BACT|nr:hypothetical protein [Gemmata palustris]MBP3956267.1 hypothetical protein [Gemmata palustris]